MRDMECAKTLKSSFQAQTAATAVTLQSAESCLSTVNDTLNSASDLRSLIDSKRKELFSEDHTLKAFAGDELAYLEEAHRRITTLHEEL